MSDRDIHVERRRNHNREVSIYDRFGGGHISLSVEDAEFVRDRLDTVLDE